MYVQVAVLPIMNNGAQSKIVQEVIFDSANRNSLVKVLLQALVKHLDADIVVDRRCVVSQALNVADQLATTVLFSC